MDTKKRSSRSIGIVVLACCTVLIATVIVVFLLLFPAEDTHPAGDVSDYEWTSWANELEQDVYTNLAEEEQIQVRQTQTGYGPALFIEEETATLGNPVSDDLYLDNTGEIEGKIAIFYNTEGQLVYLPFDENADFGFRDEVLDASTYVSDTRRTGMPFSADRYASKPDECETLIIIHSGLASGDEATINEKTSFSDTEVIIIDVSDKELQHIEYLGVCLSERVSQSPFSAIMRAEAMAYLASLSVDGIPSDKLYTTPYRNEDEGFSDEELDAFGVAHEVFLAAGDFGEYNTMVIYIIERDTPIVSNQQVQTVAVRLYQIENETIIASNLSPDIEIISDKPYQLSFIIDGGFMSVTGNVGYEDISGTITLADNTSQEFTAPISMGGCRNCQGTGLIDGETDPQCSGSGIIAVYGELRL